VWNLHLGEALLAYEAIKKYGYSVDKPVDKEEVQKLSMLGSQAFDSLRTNVDLAIGSSSYDSDSSFGGFGGGSSGSGGSSGDW
jgi:uncharacterized membrane protein YgcG